MNSIKVGFIEVMCVFDIKINRRSTVFTAAQSAPDVLVYHLSLECTEKRRCTFIMRYLNL